jgi:cyanophycin synthetase
MQDEGVVLMDKFFIKEAWSYAGGSKLSTYAITLEAWRRGLIVTFKDIRLHKYTICGDKLIAFNQMVINDPSFKQVKDICRNKDLAKTYLSRANLPVPEGKRFYAHTTDQEIIKYSKHLSFPVVLKPNFGSRGRGVIANINDEGALADYLVYVRQELNFPDVIIEKFIVGEDYRINVVGKEVVRAIKRVPANIIGNGINTIHQLIKYKNIEKKKHPFLSKNLIKIGKDVLINLERTGYNLQSIPSNGELIYLKDISNLSAGGDRICVAINEVPEIIKKIAVEAVEAIPNLNYCGVDILFNESKALDQQVVVIELNSTALVGMDLFEGDPTSEVANAILDLYFPESCKNRLRNINLFFNLRLALQPLKDGVASEIKITPAPTGKIASKRIEISGLIQGVNFEKWAKKTAMKLKLIGHLKYLNKSKLLIIIAGNEEDVENFESLCLTGPKKAQIDSVTTKPWDKMVMAGFVVKAIKKS